MSVFRRRKKQEPVEEEVFVDDLDEQDREHEDALLEAELQARPAPPPRPQGPWDVADAPDDGVARIDLGGLLVPVPEDTEVRVDLSPEGEVVSATLVQGPSTVQVNGFAAPRTEGIGSEVLEEIASSLRATGGEAQLVDGALGPELQAHVPTELPGQGIVMAPARFVGVDGPRWFLRALFTGPAAVDPVAAAGLEQAVRDVVVVRGSDPMAVRDALALRLPPEAVQQVAEQAAEQEQPDPLGLAGRGPEITEIR